MKGKNDENRILDYQELERCLNNFIEQNVISKRVATKIITKIHEKNLEFTKQDLVTLIQTLQKTSPGKTKKTVKKESINQGKNDYGIDIGSEPFKELNHELAIIESKIENIEEHQKQMFDNIHQTDHPHDEPQPDPQDCSMNHDMEPLVEIRNTPENVVILMRWLQYLIDKLGQNNLSDILDYYVNIEWISEDVRLDLIKYAKGITFKEPEGKQEQKKPMFTIDDHLQSFMFIQKLKGNSFHEDFLLKINCKIDKMGKTIQRHIV